MTMLSPKAVGSVDTRRSITFWPTLILIRPSCGTRFSAMLTFDISLIRDTMDGCKRLGGFSTSCKTPSIR